MSLQLAQSYGVLAHTADSKEQELMPFATAAFKGSEITQDFRLPVKHVSTQVMGEGGQRFLRETSLLGTFALGHEASQCVLTNSQDKTNVEIYSFVM